MRRKVLATLGVVSAALLLGASPVGAQEAVDIPLDDTQMILDNIFVFICACLVLFMQAGFALVEAGLTSAKNVASILMKNVMDMCLGILLFALVGYHIAYSGESIIGFSWLWARWAGRMNNDSISEMRKTEMTISGMLRTDRPVTPGMNRSGVKAMIVVSTENVTGIATSRTPAIAASTPRSPVFWRW